MRAGDPPDPNRLSEYVSQRLRMPELAGFRHGLVQPRACLIDITEIRQDAGEMREHGRIGIGNPGAGAMRRIAKAMTLLQQRAGGNELPEVEAGHPVCAAPL